MKIVVLTTLQNGGAPIAAMNAHQALLAMGQNSTICFLETQDRSDHTLALSSSCYENNNAMFWSDTTISHWMNLVSTEKLFEGCSEVFSDSVVGLFGLSPAAVDVISTADVINLHWVPGLLFSPELISLIIGKRIVLTLHDMNAFTGGCHYHISCQKYETQCANCPLLDNPSAADLSYQNFKFKKNLYALLRPSVISPSHWLAAKVKQSALLGDAMTTVVRNTYDMDTFAAYSNERRLQLRRKHNIDDKAIVVLAGTGDLANPRKNLSMLFDAWQIIETKQPDLTCTLMLFGHGHPPEQLKKVYNMGYIDSSSAMAELYNMADLFIHPSLLDNLPNCNGESQCCGTPIMTFNTGGNGETYLPDETGFLVKETSAQAMAEKLIPVLQKPEQLNAMRQPAREFMENQFSNLVMAQGYVEVFNKTSISEEMLSADNLNILLQNHINSLAALFRLKTLQWQETCTKIKRALNAVDLNFTNSNYTINENLQTLNENLQTLNEKGQHTELKLIDFEKQLTRLGEKCSFKGLLGLLKRSVIKAIKTTLKATQHLFANHPRNRNLPDSSYSCIGIDCLNLISGVSGGVESYMEMLVNCLLDHPKYYPVLICHEEQYHHYVSKFQHKVGYRIHTVPWLIKAASKVSELLRGRPISFADYVANSFSDLYEVSKIVLLHSPVQLFSVADFTIPSVLNLHDLQHLHLPENFSQEDIAARNELYPRAAARADIIIATSHFVANDIAVHGYAPYEKIRIIPAAWNSEILMGLNDFSAAQAGSYYSLPENYIFYPAQFWPHKNHTRLVEALAIVRNQIPEINLHLVLTGNRVFAGWPATKQIISKYKLEEVVICLDRIPTQHMAALYQSALFCVVPSTFEASSYPVIEAQLMGCPVMCSNVTSLPELVADGAGILFDPWSAHDMAEKIIVWLKDPAKAKAAAKIAYDKVRRDHSPQKYTQKIVQVYDELLTKKKLPA